MKPAPGKANGSLWLCEGAQGRSISKRFGTAMSDIAPIHRSYVRCKLHETQSPGSVGDVILPIEMENRVTADLRSL